MINRIIYFLAVFMLFSGCYEDKSSDKYEPIGSITVSGINSSYEVVAFIDELTITPVVTSSDPDDKVDEFKYMWTYYLPRSSSPYRIDTLQHTRDIVGWKLNVDSGTYTAVLRITNPANGYTVYKTTTIQVTTDFSNGFYFLKETADGNTELDFLSFDGNMFASDLIEARTGAPITGKPTRIGQFYKYMHLNNTAGEKALFPMGGKDLKVFDINNVSLLNDFATIFYDGVQPDEKPLFAGYFAALGNHMLFTNKGCYLFPYQYATSGKIGKRISPAGGCDFTGGTILKIRSSAYGVLFDELNDRLVFYDSNGNLLTLVGENGYKPTGITHHLLFIGTSGWAVFEDDKDAAVRYLYQINGNSSNNPAANPILDIRTIDAVSAPNFNKADVYGSSKNFTYSTVENVSLYAAVGDQFYVYNTGNDTETRYTPVGMGSGEQITMITHKKDIPNPQNPSDKAGLLFIGTYKDGNYKVYMYKITGDVPDGAPVLVASGVGKVADAQFVGTGGVTRPDANY